MIEIKRFKHGSIYFLLMEEDGDYIFKTAASHKGHVDLNVTRLNGGNLTITETQTKRFVRSRRIGLKLLKPKAEPVELRSGQ